MLSYREDCYQAKTTRDQHSRRLPAAAHSEPTGLSYSALIADWGGSSRIRNLEIRLVASTSVPIPRGDLSLGIGE